MDCPACGKTNPEEARFCSKCGALLAAPEPHGLVGQMLGGRYLVRRVIGEGGMGVVYEADQRMGSHLRKVAIKTLLPELSHDHTLVSRFYRECGTVSQLEHPNTIRFYDFGETPDGALYIAMEYVDGVALTDVLGRGPMPVPRALDILRQVCGALEEAHGLGIVHRDLKPDNIILTERAGDPDFVKLLDFGIATRTGPAGDRQTKLTQQGTVLGTPPYMSPEQLAGEPLDGRSDLYSLAVIAYEMLTGQLPFVADSPWQWAHKHMTEPPRPLGTFPGLEFPPSVVFAVMRALAKNRDDRPSTALEFYRELTGDQALPNVAGATQGALAPTTSPMDAPLPLRSGATAAGPVAFAPAVRTASAMAAPVMPAPILRRPRSSRRGWFAALGALLLVGALIAAFAFLPLRPPAEPQPLALASDAPPPETSVAPLVESPERLEPEAPVSTAPLPVVTAKPRPPASKPTAPPPATTAPPPATTAPPPATTAPSIKLPPRITPPNPTPTVQPKPPAPSGPTGDAACAAASGMASSNTEGAVAMYHTCKSTGGSASAQASALSRIRSGAPAVVRTRAFNGDCAGARRAANAASSVGAGAAAMAELSKAGC